MRYSSPILVLKTHKFRNTHKVMSLRRIMTKASLMTTPTSRNRRHRPSPRATRTAPRPPLNRDDSNSTQADRVPLKLEKD